MVEQRRTLHVRVRVCAYAYTCTISDLFIGTRVVAVLVASRERRRLVLVMIHRALYDTLVLSRSHLGLVLPNKDASERMPRLSTLSRADWPLERCVVGTRERGCHQALHAADSG